MFMEARRRPPRQPPPVKSRAGTTPNKRHAPRDAALFLERRVRSKHVSGQCDVGEGGGGRREDRQGGMSKTSIRHVKGLDGAFQNCNL